MIGFIVLVVTYFVFSWGLPWHKIPSTISFSYIFDFLFALGVCFIFRLPWKFKWKFHWNTLASFLEVLALGCATIFCIWFMEIQVPFRLMQNLEWHLLLFAPVLEELVFRQTFQRLLIKNMGGKRVTSMLVAAVFAFSHLIALKVLPADYIPFVGFQVFYTFVLGVICGQGLLRLHSVFAPITLHFLFNLTFYLALYFEII